MSQIESKKSSPRRIAASRANGALSHGPTSSTGKLASAANSFKHGMLAQSIVLDSESRPRFLALLDALFAEHRPITESELALVQTLAVARWRQMRTWSVQKSDFDREISRQDPAPAPLRAANAFRTLTDTGRTLDVALRYEMTFERQFSRALRDLTRLKSNRSPQPEPTPISVFTDSTFTWDADPETETTSQNISTQNEPNPAIEHLSQKGVEQHPGNAHVLIGA